MADEEKIVEAVGTAGGSGVPGLSAGDIERAMAEAVQKAYDEGITDPDEIRRLQLEARARVKEEARLREEQAAGQA